MFDVRVGLSAFILFQEPRCLSHTSLRLSRWRRRRRPEMILYGRPNKGPEGPNEGTREPNERPQGPDEGPLWPKAGPKGPYKGSEGPTKD
jgi:hypothetical protein